MEQTEELIPKKKSEVATRQLHEQMIWSLLQPYVRRLAKMPSDVFRQRMETLRSRVMNLLDTEDMKKEQVPASYLQARIVSICDENDMLIPVPLTCKSEGVAQEMKSPCKVETWNVSVPKGNAAKKRRSRATRKKEMKPKPVEFLEDDAEDDYGSTSNY